jgi:hypothetical protein
MGKDVIIRRIADLSVFNSNSELINNIVLYFNLYIYILFNIYYSYVVSLSIYLLLKT